MTDNERPPVVHDPDGHCPARWFVFGAHDWVRKTVDWPPGFQQVAPFREVQVCNWCGGRKP